ncbi:MAG: FAD-dependent thymidylate synthase [Chlorobi bacterium]|nr:FAD-dependent thymidylate synthase [Chlorobiota bacterium]
MDERFEKLEPIRVSALDEILGEPFKVLDDGFIRVIDYMGNDSSIVQAARVSYGKGTKKMREDRGLIRYLLRHHHTTPFEMCEIKLHLRIPMDAWRQWIRHRTANVNEYSTRYSIAIDAAMKTLPGEWRMQAKVNRQGSEGFLEEELGREMTEDELKLHAFARDIYNKRIESGVAREQARKDLPLSTYTEAYWKIDLHNLLHFLRLRMEKNAQLEIRKYAEIIGREIVKRWVPVVWEAFEEYSIGSTQFSSKEIELLKFIYSGEKEKVNELAASLGWLKEKEGNLSANIERMEFEQKLDELGISYPW